MSEISFGEKLIQSAKQAKAYSAAMSVLAELDTSPHYFEKIARV